MYIIPITIEAAAEIDALTARVAELERERQYTCEQHRDEVRKGERCVWCELAAARGAFDLSESERQRLAGRINATEAELETASKTLRKLRAMADETIRALQTKDTTL